MMKPDEFWKTLYAWEAAVKLCREDAEERRQESYNLQREAESLHRHGHAIHPPEFEASPDDGFALALDFSPSI